MKSITYKVAKKRFRYYPSTGTFFGVYGRPLKTPYVHGKFGRAEVTHVIWLLMTGKLPKRGNFIDHINRDRSDNRWKNLREVTPQQSAFNRIKPNLWGLSGVPIRSSHKSFAFQIQVHGKRRYFGGFKTADEASVAYKAASRKLHGEFSPWISKSSSPP